MRPRVSAPAPGAPAAGTEVSLSFLTPFGALVALAALLPVGMWLLRERRTRAVRRELGLEEPRRAGVLALGVALAAIPVLLGVAAAQPVLDRN